MLWVSALIALGAAVAVFRTTGELGQIAAAQADLDRARAQQHEAADDMRDALGQLKAYLAAVKTGAEAPATYDEWSAQQRRAHEAVGRLRQRAAGFEPLAPLASLPASQLAPAIEAVRAQTTALSRKWLEYDQLGSGLTPKSVTYATGTLAPLMTDELEPALGRFEAAFVRESEQRAGALPALAQNAQLVRMLACLGFLPLVGAAFHAFKAARPKGSMVSRAEAHASELHAHAPTAVARVPAPVVADYASQAAALARGKRRILVGANDEASCELLSLLLTQAGYATIVCGDGHNALAAVRAVRFDLLLLDRRMPGAGVGEILAEGRHTHPAQPVIFLVASDADTNPPPMKDGGFVGALRLPVDPRSLLEKVAAAFGEERPRPAIVERPEPEPAIEPEPAPPAPAEPARAIPKVELPKPDLPPITPPPPPPPSPPAQPPPVAPAVVAPEPLVQPASEPAATETTPSIAPSDGTTALQLPRKRLVRKKPATPSEGEGS